MADFDNLFDEAMALADTTIRGVMGAEARITSGSLSGVTLRGVFDDPENIGYAEVGIRIDGTRPTLFVNTSDVSGLERLDTLKVNGREFWVDRVGPDDCGSCHVWLGSGSPPGGSRRR
ncbi:head-tail joining protein [Enterobacter mori]|uniref:head-tail joining protein n=1 Tax=Enterobacter mori TaxID=539813 RepID=UPI003D1A229A